MSDAPPESYPITFFNRATDNQPKPQRLTLPELDALFTNHEVRDSKDGPLFSSATFGPGKTRANAHVLEIYYAVGDFDRGDVSPEHMHGHLGRLGLCHWIYSTHSSKPGKPKFRVVVLLARPVPAARWGDVWPALIRELFLGGVDLGTRDPSRMFYLPSAPPGSTPFTYRGKGVAFDWTKLRIDPELRKVPLTRPSDTSPIATGERRPKLMSIAGRLRNAGAGYDAILAELRDVNLKRCVEKLTERDLEHITASACRYEPGPPKRAAPAGPAPPLEEFDPEIGEVFATTDSNGMPDLGIAWVIDGRIARTTVSAELRRIGREYDAATQEKGQKAEEAAEDRDRKQKRLLHSLPFTHVKHALWPLPNDPTVVTLAEWERANGPLLARIVRYYHERVSTNDPDGHLVLALWTMGASARSPEIDYAPRLMFEAPFGWGKSTGAEAVQLVVSRGVYGAALTPASVHRMMNEWHPVLLVDESAISDNPELQRVLRAGFKRGAKIIRAAQNQDRGVVLIDPFGFVILTTQVDTREDLVSRCYVLHLFPGTPPKRVTIRDPEATEVRTLLVRLRLDILAGSEYRNLGAIAETARSKPGLEPRSRDKLTALWAFAVRYGVEDRLATVAGRLEEEAAEQLAASDKGIVVAAIAAVVARAGGLENLKAKDLELQWIHEQVEHLLIEQGEATVVPVGGGETVARIDLKRYGPRDFTGRLVRELGFKIHTKAHRARLTLMPFVTLWPSVWSRYGGNTTLDDVEERDGVLSEKTLLTLPLSDISSSGEATHEDTPPTLPQGGGTLPEMWGRGSVQAPDLAAPRGPKTDSASANADSNGSRTGDCPVVPARLEAASRELTGFLRSTGSASREAIRRVLSASGFVESEISAAIGAVCGGGVVRIQSNGDLSWKEAEA
ncbi:MAG: hypothetical protein LVQ64_00905 [Thermoplasmatales archaeon]|nr:hypothetical protein [Thermoplasmatales archaeon]